MMQLTMNAAQVYLIIGFERFDALNQLMLRV